MTKINPSKIVQTSTRILPPLKEQSAYFSLDAVPWREVFPEVSGNEAGAALRGLRLREDLTQSRLSELTGIPQRHISEMENGKRAIGREMAKKLAAVLHSSYKVFL
ncbi:MAG: helix-turn-helix domain-containing protein [Geobacteraceae bacterium]|nr:helix-turn-helix domain-containing protein [Geobacteraceae bacterium]